MSEQSILSGEQCVQERVERYKAAAKGLLSIYTFSFNGEIQREVVVENPENPLEVQLALHEDNYRGFDTDGNEISLTLDDPMTPGELMELADSLETHLKTIS